MVVVGSVGLDKQLLAAVGRGTESSAARILRDRRCEDKNRRPAKAALRYRFTIVSASIDRNFQAQELSQEI